MKRAYLSLTLTVLLSSVANAGPVFDGTTLNMKPTSDQSRVITVKGEGEKKEQIEVLDVDKYLDLKYQRDSSGRIRGLDFNQRRMSEMLKDTAPLKVGTVMAFQKNSKHMVMMSENQRFIFIGQLYDVFNGMRKINNVDDVRNYAQRLNYELMGIDPEEMNSVSIGSGPQKVVIWVAPTSPYTRMIMDEAISLSKSDEGKSFTFYFVVIPADSAESFELTKRFMCAREEGNNRIGNLLYEDALDTLPKADCKLSKSLEKTLVYKNLSDVDLVPYTVAPDGRVARGMPAPNLKQFLLDNHKDVGLDTSDPEQKEIRAELEDQIVDRALDNEIENLNSRTDYDALSATLSSAEAKQKNAEREIEELKAQYAPRIKKYQDRIASENITYNAASKRVREARDTLSDDSRMDYLKKSKRLEEYQGRIQALDEKHHRRLDDYNKSIEKLQKELRARIDEISSRV